ncbi:MAG: RIO1 family regulatory kinase/ATPase, partial [Nanoarchaeota archaeon]|nr:RIO1 family regulatory kinase/ATPase [Nanoarchaeota archaeon]
KVGKESNVFLASKDTQQVIVKIYRVQNCDFKRMYEYIGKDPRYSYLKKHRRDIIFAWAQREYKNLLRAEEAGILAPKPLAFRNNIIVEEMIGDQEPALQLKNRYPANPAAFFKQLILQIKKLYRKGLIHGDLSSFNILNFNEKPYLIDFSQTTLVKTPNSEELLERDVTNIIIFFRKLGIEADLSQTIQKIKK